MRPSQISNLKPGDRVFWNDPDDGACSREYKISSIESFRNGHECVVRITEENGSCLECLADELEPPEPREDCPPAVGEGATIYHYTDVSAGTVSEVRTVRGRTEVIVREDKAIRTDDNGMSDQQSYRFEPDPEGMIYVVRFRKETKKTRAGWYEYHKDGRLGTSERFGWRVEFGGRMKYHDYSF